MATDINSSLHDDIREMRRMLNDVAASQVRTETTAKELKERLFDNTMGSIPVLFSKCAKNETAAQSALDKLAAQKYYVGGLSVGVTIMLGFVRFVLGKLGWHI